MIDPEEHQDHEIQTLDLTQMKILCPLGRGAKGVVFRVRVSGSDQDLALKVVLKASLKGKNGSKNSHDDCKKKDEFGRIGFEREVLKCLRHPLLPRLRGVLETENVVGYAMDYCPGRDLNWVRRQQSEKMFSDEIIRFYGAEIVLALEHLHNLGIVYRDLKPENILIQENGHLMLVDFDLSTKLAPRSPGTRFSSPESNRSSDPPRKKTHRPTILRFCNSGFKMENSELNPKSESDSNNSGELESGGKSNSFVGTEDYVAPEIITGDGHDYAVDWWCFGVVLYEMLYGTTPFRGANRKETFYRIISKKPDLAGETTSLRDLIWRLLEKEPMKRIQVEEIKGHDFFKGVDWEMIWQIQRPPIIPAIEEIEDMDGIKKIDVESIVRGIFIDKNGDVENKSIKWVEGLEQPSESQNFTVF